MAQNEATVTTREVTRQVQDLDPRTLLVDVNVRHDTRIDKDFLASIRQHGVLQPIIAVRTTDGAVRVRLGHRRTLAAVEAGLATVPVIVAADENDDDATQIDRLIHQHAENAHRAGLSTAENADVVAQLAAFGVSPAQIAKRTRMPRTQVDAALAVTGSDLATAATARYEFLTLEQAAVLAEFESEPETVKALVAAAQTGSFDHVAQRARDDRQEREAIAVITQTLTANGLRVIDRKDVQFGKAERLDALTNDPENRTPLTAQDHTACPGHAAYIKEEWVWATTADTSADTTDDTAVETSDGTTDATPGANADEGAAEDLGGDTDDTADTDADEEQGSYQYVPVYVCTDPAAHGHQSRYSYRGQSTQRKTAAEMSDDEREAARAERRRVVENNKSWDSSDKVRLAWLKNLAARKTAPKGTSTFLALAAAHDADLLAGIDGNHLAADLLGLNTGENGGYGRNTRLQTLLTTVTDQRAQVIHLVMALAAYEKASSREDWRSQPPRARRYLTHLAALGYTLSDVEHLACGRSPHDATGNTEDTGNGNDTGNGDDTGENAAEMGGESSRG